MLGTPFLTSIDPRARVKGSRDPLGLQPIWTRLGRRIVCNLTTVTTSLRGFTVLLLGLYFAERCVEDREGDVANFSKFFLKFEQLAAYSRVAWKQFQTDGLDEESEVRGIMRVRKNLLENKVRISAGQEGQILSDQEDLRSVGLVQICGS